VGPTHPPRLFSSGWAATAWNLPLSSI
jgi:hypothetical protein